MAEKYFPCLYVIFLYVIGSIAHLSHYLNGGRKMTRIKKKTLYFDIHGTILDASTKAVKKNLQNGQLELKIRKLNFDNIFCLGDINEIFKGLDDMGQHVESVEILYTLCFDAFTDFSWFVKSINCLKTPEKQFKQLDFKQDWWYMDDQAPSLLRKFGKGEILKQDCGNRILIPNPESDGHEIISWLENIEH